MKSHRRFCVVALFVLFALGARDARAQVTVYDDPADFNAATAANTTYAFPEPSSGMDQSVGTSYTDGPLTFGGSALYLENDGAYGSGTYLAEGNSAETISLTGASDLSFTLGTFNGAQTIDISVNGVATTTVTESGGYPNKTFVGFKDTVPITSLTFTDASSPGAEIDVTSFQVDTVPEPSAWAMMLCGSGLVIVGLLRRARQA